MTFSSQTKPLNDVFAAPLRDHAAQRAATDPAFRSLPDAFPNRNRLHQYFLYTFVPRNLAWAFKPNNKAGSSSVLAFLFALEFGQPLSAEITDPFEQDTITHRLAEARLLARLPEHLDVSDAQRPALAQCLRFDNRCAHPASRLRGYSVYFYICRAQSKPGPKLSPRHRLRMTALVWLHAWRAHTWHARRAFCAVSLIGDRPRRRRLAVWNGPIAHLPPANTLISRPEILRSGHSSVAPKTFRQLLWQRFARGGSRNYPIAQCSRGTGPPKTAPDSRFFSPAKGARPASRPSSEQISAAFGTKRRPRG